MNRITMKDLNAVVGRINQLQGTPNAPYAFNSNTGRHEPQARCYHLSGAYGGYALEQMCDTGTGVRTIIGGYMPKRDLYERMHAFIRGLEAAKGE